MPGIEDNSISRQAEGAPGGSSERGLICLELRTTAYPGRPRAHLEGHAVAHPCGQGSVPGGQGLGLDGHHLHLQGGSEQGEKCVKGGSDQGEGATRGRGGARERPGGEMC